MRRSMRLVYRAMALAAAVCCSGAIADDTARADRLDDFDAFCRFVADDYAYFDIRRTDWPAACAAHRQAAADAVDRAAFIGVVERTLAELHDFHAHLGTSTPQSWRLVPTDGDVSARWQGDDAVVDDVRASSAAWSAGLRPGMRLVEVDGRPIADAVDAIAPRHLRSPDPAARDWALRVVLAGHQDRNAVRVVAERAGVTSEFAYVPGIARDGSLLSTHRAGTVGVIAIHNALGDSRLIADFDAALATMDDASALVLDLRDTPSGGNTTVGRGVMSRFVSREAPYQRHEAFAEFRETGVRRVWVEYVEPRGKTFDKPVVVLVGRWTGSMSEGIAIGLDAARHAPVVGTPMAGLLGALDELKLPHAGFVVRVPAERLSHVDGTRREDFVPCPLASHGRGAEAEGSEAVEIAKSMSTSTFLYGTTR